MHRQGAILAVAGLARLAKAGLYPDMSYDNHTCVLSDPILSCSDQADPDKVDTCCTETFGGLVVSLKMVASYDLN
jgi:ribonuclease T2